MLKLRASIPHHIPSSCSKLRNSYQRLQRYGSGQTDGHTRPTTRFSTGEYLTSVMSSIYRGLASFSSRSVCSYFSFVFSTSRRHFSALSWIFFSWKEQCTRWISATFYRTAAVDHQLTAWGVMEVRGRRSVTKFQLHLSEYLGNSEKWTKKCWRTFE